MTTILDRFSYSIKQPAFLPDYNTLRKLDGLEVGIDLDNGKRFALSLQHGQLWVRRCSNNRLTTLPRMRDVKEFLTRELLK